MSDSSNQRDITIDAALFAEMDAYAQLHAMPVSDVIARAWALYRDMAAMRAGHNVPAATIARYQEAQGMKSRDVVVNSILSDFLYGTGE